ncbi:hypothetical protein Ddc_19910 [Ditylenchus destructor]|nr:hypothetical protein Ddc_19910 [Ditylenchus destructor]
MSSTRSCCSTKFWLCRFTHSLASSLQFRAPLCRFKLLPFPLPLASFHLFTAFVYCLDRLQFPSPFHARCLRSVSNTVLILPIS